METCFICKREFKKVTHTHLEQSHGLKQDEYNALLEDLDIPTIESNGEDQKVLHGTISDVLNGIWSKK